jgi:Domain of unknown function (DUF4349)
MRRNTVAAVLAACIVLALAALGGSKLQQSGSSSASSQVESVSLAKRSGIAADLYGAPQGQAMPAPAARAQANDSLAAPQIARTGKVSLFVGSVDNAVASLTAIAHRQSGDVFSLQVDNASAAANASGEMDIRVPAQRFDETMSAIGQTGKIRERSVSAQDLTGNITDSSARLRNLRRTEADIRKIMDRSGTVGQVLDAENQLSQVREQIETLESDLKTMHAQVVYSTISVTLEAEAANAPVEPKAASQLATAWNAALHALSQTTVALIAFLLWLVVFAPYIALVAVAGLVIYAQLRKRRGVLQP